MLAPSWLTNGLAVAMLTVAAYCASRLIVARRLHRTTNYSADAVHTAMGVAMAGMLTSRLASSAIWVVVFAASASWFGARALRGIAGIRAPAATIGSHLRHVVTCGAMVYMLTATPAVAAASTPATTTMTQLGAATSVRFPTLALLFGLFMIGYTVMVTDRLSRGASQPADRQILAPRTVAGCQIAMNITMGYMLVTLL